VLHGGGKHPPFDATVRHAQAQRICHQRLPARSLVERVVSPPPIGLGRDTPKNTPTLVVLIAAWLIEVRQSEGRAPRRGIQKARPLPNLTP
jgi:hypothetical protein